MAYQITKTHPELEPFADDIELRMQRYYGKRAQLLSGGHATLKEFANAHNFFGFHKEKGGWVYREWAPGADQLFLTGDFNGWQWVDNPMEKLDNGVWELHLSDKLIKKGSKVMTIVQNGDKLTQHLPLYTRRAVQDWVNQSWCCEVWDDVKPYKWTDKNFKCDEPPIIY